MSEKILPNNLYIKPIVRSCFWLASKELCPYELFTKNGNNY
jgi:hypothetical protein